MFVGGCGATTGSAKVSLVRAAALPSLDDVCPSTRTDALCAALRETEVSDSAAAGEALKTARAEVATQVATRLASGSSEPWDPAVRFYVRERITALLAWYVITAAQLTGDEPPAYDARVDEVLRRHFPSYQPSQFPIAHIWLPPPADTTLCDEEKRDLVLVLPGVARVLARDEFAQQMGALRARFPCLIVERVETLSFVEPSRNAERVAETVARHPDAARIHLFGYSQGGLNALAALVEHPQIAARTRSVTFLDVPAHGSEVGEALYRVVRPAGWFDWLWRHSALPLPLDAAAEALGGLGGQPGMLQEWLRQEGSGQTTLSGLLHDRIAGIRSLGTSYAQEFWDREGSRLPRTPLYAGFRAIITNPSNLPASNAPFFAFVAGVEPKNPHNDMQVRLTSQQMGGALGDYEVLGPVAEGNHWQWALVPGNVADAMMSPKLTANMPHSEMLLAYYSTFAEIGLLGKN